MFRLTRRVATAALVLHCSTANAQNTTISPTTTATSTVCATVLTPSYSPPVVADGWRAQLVATGLSSPRGLVFDSNGGLLVVEARVGVTHLRLADNGGTCVSVESNTTVISDDQVNHGIELSADGRTLYVSTDENVDSHAYDPDTASVTQMRRLVANMTNPGRGHVTRTLLLSRKQPDLLLVSRGSATNIDPLAADLASGVSQIRAFNISNVTDIPRPYSYPTDGLLVGRGLRNSVGVAEHPVTGGIWSVENSADNVERLGRDIHEDNPGEELNFHGVLNDTSTLGADYGYPFCFALWNTTDFPELGNMTVGDQFALLGDDDDTVNDTMCATLFTPPRLTFRAHMAPLDIKFSPSDRGARAFVSFHGSWNRDEPAGYKLSYVRFSPQTGEPTEPRDSLTAAVDVMTAPDLSACRPQGAGAGCFRPAGLAFDATGERLFVSSDATGEIWVVMRDSESEDGEDGGGSGTATTATVTETGTQTAGPAASTSSAAAGPGVVYRGWGGQAWAVVALTAGMMALGGLTFVG